ncbi:MAG TPA: TonB-dependent receptor [Candidatus Aminicenantes bacterium]|nr:TonB-dependent receptor [Candidatus Aminicenantes bacterium]HRY63907.1 TonB-dependent receptor [Candidatus Aminicenantes bacterium]HRZ70820.1 TonB-dependent receptor [Candidatus Aminicenantes bacterium]
MRSLKALFVALLALSSAVGVFGQMIPTGQLAGTVTDTDKAPLPGVSVTISSPSLMLPSMAATTNENGLYRFFSLPSGTYKVTFELNGFRTVVREGIIISASRTVTLDVPLEQGGIEESITVVGESPTVDLKQTQTGTTYTKDLIATLPLSRDLASIFNSAPGMFARTSYGSDARSNNFVVDGVKMQDPVTGDPYQTVPWNAIDEVEIETSNQKAEYGAVKGALVNVITKAGGNNFSGGVNFYYRNKDLQSDNTKGTPFEGQYVGFRYQYLPGFSLGGPIVKDKVWFFTSLDIDKSSSYTQGFPAPATYGGAQPESAPIGQTTIAPFGKVTWQLSERDKIVASGYWRGYKWDHRGASRWTVLNANYTEDSAVTIATAQWTRTMSKDVLFNLKGSWYSLHQYLLANDDQAPILDEALDYVNRGGAGSDWWYSRRRAEVTSDLTWYKDNWLGSHEFKAGADAEFSFDGTECAYYQDPVFDGVFADGFKAVDIFLWDGQPNWAWVGTEYKQKNNLIQVGGFLQDTWSPIKRLTLNLGVRLDHAQGNYPPQKKRNSDEWVNENSIKAMDFTMFSPRAGLTFALTADGKTVLKAGFGRYYAPLLMIYYYFNNPNQRSSFMAQLNSDWSVNYTTPVQSPGTTTVDPDISSPYADEINVGIERELMEDFSVSATFIAKWEKNLIDDVDRAHLDWQHYLDTGDLVWSGYHAVEGTDPFTGQSVTFYEMNEDFGDYGFVFQNVPGTARKYTGLEFKLTKRMSHRWAMQSSYVWSNGRGILNTSRDQSTGFTGFYDDPNSMINAYGLLDNQREHLVKVQGTYAAPWGITVSGYYQFGSGVPYTRIIRSYEAGLGSLYQGGVSIFAEERGLRRLPDQHLLDLRIEKAFNVGRGQIAVQLDAYNVFNNNRATSVGNTTNYDMFLNSQAVYAIMSPRYFQLGVIYRF